MFIGINLIYQALASTIDEEELADLRDQFDAIDVDKNGAISLEEMRQVSSFRVHLDEKIWRRISNPYPSILVIFGVIGGGFELTQIKSLHPNALCFVHFMS